MSEAAVQQDSESSGLLLISHNFQSIVWSHFVQFGIIIVRRSKIECSYFVTRFIFGRSWLQMPALSLCILTEDSDVFSVPPEKC
jgi:hypothetical protein